MSGYLPLQPHGRCPCSVGCGGRVGSGEGGVQAGCGSGGQTAARCVSVCVVRRM